MTSKYHAVPVVIDGIRFDSKLEGRRYSQLKIRQAAGEIIGLALQQDFALVVCGDRIGSYVADFTYFIPGTMELVIEDAKGVLTPLCRWKLKHMAAQGNPVTLWPEPKKKTRKKKGTK